MDASNTCELIAAVSANFGRHSWTIDIAESFSSDSAPCWVVRLRIAPKDHRRSAVDHMIAGSDTKEQAIKEAIDSIQAWAAVLKLD